MKARLFPLLLACMLALMCAGAQAEETVLTGSETVTLPLDDETDSDALFLRYIEAQVRQSAAPLLRRIQVDGRLTEPGKQAYLQLVPLLKQVAAGSRSSTEFSLDMTALGLPEGGWTREELGVTKSLKELTQTERSAVIQAKVQETFGMNTMLRALLQNLPYDLYWFNKTSRDGGAFKYTFGYSYTAEYARLTRLTCKFPVISAYAAEDSLHFNTALAAAAIAAAQKAQQLVNECAEMEDFERLQAYEQQIMDLTAYNREAAGSDTYGDPWQLIWVFDGDPDTSVVCEGYAKAFQLLCDLTDFNTAVNCSSVTGTMGVGSGRTEAHMWNLVTLEDGTNYLVDVTNSDTGTVGSQGGLFMAGYASEIRNSDGRVSGYTIVSGSGANVHYVYNADALDLFWDTELTLSPADYGGPDWQSWGGLRWLNQGGKLMIRGAWDMPEGEPAPWLNGETIRTAVLEDGITSVSSGAFRDLDRLTAIRLPDSVETIADDAFSGCALLNLSSLPTGLKRIGSGAFRGCGGLGVLMIRRSVEEIGEGAFNGCSGLTLIVYPGTAGYLFAWNSGVSYVTVLYGRTMTLPAGTRVIESEAFADLTYAVNIALPDSVETIADDAFRGSEVILLCRFGSAAQLYAEQHGIPYSMD